MFTKFRHSRKGFTLVELIVAMAILGIMSTMTLMIYFNISETSRRLQISREISETARQITERIAQDVREKGVLIQDVITDWEWDNDFLTQYTNEGGNILHIKNDASSRSYSYYYGFIEGDAIKPCTEPLKRNCGLITDKDWINYNLVDAFREEEWKKRVRITDLKFYITGGDNDANKVTLKMTLELAPRIWVPDRLIRATKMEVQTTFSERNYKIQ